MIDGSRELFIGIKITKELQNELDNPAPGTRHYFDGSNRDEYLQIVDAGDEKFIGRVLKAGIPAADISDASRNVCSIVRLITKGRRIDDRDVKLFSF